LIPGNGGETQFAEHKSFMGRALEVACRELQ
jgi:hypothetical protein